MNDSESDTLNNTLESYAAVLSVLITFSGLTSEVQEKIINSIPELTIEQITELVSVLEAKHAALETAGIDEALENSLKKIAEEYELRQNKYDENLIQTLENLAEKID